MGVVDVMGLNAKPRGPVVPTAEQVRRERTWLQRSSGLGKKCPIQTGTRPADLP